MTFLICEIISVIRFKDDYEARARVLAPCTPHIVGRYLNYLTRKKKDQSIIFFFFLSSKVYAVRDLTFILKGLRRK